MDNSTKDNYLDSNRLKARKNFHEKYAKPLVNLNEEIYHSIKFLGNEKILDIGCGFGDLLKFFRNSGHNSELVGIDISDGMIEEARLDNSNIKFSVADAENMDFNDNSFDIVICKHALYHFNDIDKVINEVFRILKDNGKFIITINSLDSSSRENVQNMKQFISKSLNNDNFLDSNIKVNFENYKTFIHDNFRILKEIKINRYMELNAKEPFLSYMDSFKEFWHPTPSEQDWKKAMSIVSNELSKIIEKDSVIKETISTSIIVLEKIKN